MAKRKRNNQNTKQDNTENLSPSRGTSEAEGVTKAVEELLPVETLPAETKLASASFRADEDQQLCDFMNTKKANVVSVVLVGNRFVVFYYEQVQAETTNEITLNS